MALFYKTDAFCATADRDLTLQSKGNFIAFKQTYSKQTYSLLSKPDRVMLKRRKPTRRGSHWTKLGQFEYQKQ